MSLLHQWLVPVAASPEGALLPGQLVPAAVEGKSTGRSEGKSTGRRRKEHRKEVGKSTGRSF